MRLYADNGYLNINGIDENPFIVIVGARRTGKTYGTIKKMLDENRNFVYMRRTGAEIEFSANPNTGAWLDFDNAGYRIRATKSSKYTYDFGDSPEGELIENVRGTMMALTSVSRIRGFSGANFTDIVYDEFIPERHVQKIKDEGDAFLNAYETLNGNRELQGNPPIRCWLLSNSNNLDNPILQALGIRKKLEQMQAKGQEYSVLKSRGITIVNIMNSPISKQKAGTALYKASNSRTFASMALENGFSYNDFSGIYPRPLVEYKIRCRIGNYAVFDHKNGDNVYICKIKQPCPKVYPMTPAGMRYFRINNSDLFDLYTVGILLFDSYDTKSDIAKILDFIT